MATNYTHLSLRLSSLTTGDVFSFQSSMTSTDTQQCIQNAPINHNLLYISTQYTLTHCCNYRSQVYKVQNAKSNLSDSG